MTNKDFHLPKISAWRVDLLARQHGDIAVHDWRGLSEQLLGHSADSVGHNTTLSKQNGKPNKLAPFSRHEKICLESEGITRRDPDKDESLGGM